ncbi:MAG: transposase [Pseudolabrys sp.]
MKEGKGAIKWTRLSCRTFAANAVRLQLHALAYNLGNFLRTLAALECCASRQSPDSLPSRSGNLSLREEPLAPAPSLVSGADCLQ